MESYQLLPLSSIRVVRQTRDGDFPVDDLLPSVRKYGLLEPLVVRPSGDDYELVIGRRRHKAATIAGLEKVPVVVRDLSDRQSLEVELVENLARRDLNPLEEARSIVGFLAASLTSVDQFQHTNKRCDTDEQRVIYWLQLLRKHCHRKEMEADVRAKSPVADRVIGLFERLGRSWRTFADLQISMLGYPAEVQALVSEGISPKAVREIATVKDEGLRAEVIEKARAAIADGKPDVAAAHAATGEVLRRAEAQGRLSRLAEGVGKMRQGEPDWTMPGSKWSQPTFADLSEPVWVANLAGGNAPLEVDPSIYERLMALHSEGGERVFATNAGPGAVLEAATGMGRAAIAYDPEPLRPAVLPFDCRSLPLGNDEAALGIVHLPPWDEVRLSAELGWGPDTTAADLTAIPRWETFVRECAAAVAEARRCGSTVAVICREVERGGRTHPLPAIVQIGFGQDLIAVHRFRGFGGFLWYAVVGKGFRGA